MGWEAAGLAAMIIVRSYNNFGVPAADLAAARQHADAVLQQAGVNVMWQDCWVGAGDAASMSARCDAPVGTDIVLRLQKSGEPGRSKFVSMGFSLVGLRDAAPFLATVYVDRVESVAKGASTDASRVLGLAIAHEIGHVLLDSNSHAPGGLMRADWSRNELRRKDDSAWQFLENEAARVRAAATSRHDTIVMASSGQR